MSVGVRSRALGGFRRALAVGAAIACVPLAARAFQTSVGGRPVDLDVTLSVREVIEENRSTTHERTLEHLRVRFAVSLTEWLSFDSTTTAFHGGPTMTAEDSGVFNLDDVFQNRSPAVDFEEAYLDIRLPSADLRLGKQKLAWGKLDRFQPNDLLNPLTYSDPFLSDEAERKLGVPAVQASYFLPPAAQLPAESRLTAVWVPQYVPYRFPTARCDVENGASRCDIERWFPPAAVAPQTFDVPGGIVPLPGGGTNPPFSVPVGFRVRNVPSPSWRFAHNAIGLRYSAVTHGADVALYYFHGFDPQPAFSVAAEAVGQAAPQNPLGVTGLAGMTTLTPAFHQIDAGGFDVAYAIDRVTVRGEWAYIGGRPFSRDLRTLVTDPRALAPQLTEALAALARGAGRAPVDLPASFVRRDAVEWGVGADYVHAGYWLLLQINQTDVLDNGVNLLIEDIETRLLANLRKSFLSETLQAQLLAVYGIDSDYSIVRPRLRYRLTDALTAEAGYLFIAGRAHSTGGQFRRNDQGWVRLEYRI